MRRLSFVVSVSVVMLAASSVATAGVLVNTTAGVTQDPTNPSLFKTPPMSNSDTLRVTWAVHVKGVAPHNWAGVMFDSHIMDSSEVSLQGIFTLPGLLPGTTVPGPTAQSAAMRATWWHSAAAGSGITPPTSVPIPFGGWTLHVMGSTPANNSDSDLSAVAYSIFHLKGGGSVVVLKMSDYVYGTSAFVPTESEPFPYPPPYPGEENAHWVHIPFTVTYTVPPGFSSGFYTKPLGRALLGIEHVPEPATALLLLGGAGALFASRRSKKRRLA